MMITIMSDDDIACLKEFMDAGNGEAIYEFAEDNPKDVHSADEYIALMKKSADAGCHLAAEDLAYSFEKGKIIRFCGNDFSMPVDEEEARKYNRLAEVLKDRWEESNKGKILVCDFNGWMQIRCGGHVFWNSYIYYDVPICFLSMCINKLESGAPLAEWFCDEDNGYNISEEDVGESTRLVIRWKDDDMKDQYAEFPDYDFERFAAQIATDIESNYFGFALFMTRCDGYELCMMTKELKENVAKLRSLLGSRLAVKSGPPESTRMELL